MYCISSFFELYRINAFNELNESNQDRGKLLVKSTYFDRRKLVVAPRISTNIFLYLCSYHLLFELKQNILLAAFSEFKRWWTVCVRQLMLRLNFSKRSPFLQSLNLNVCVHSSCNTWFKLFTTVCTHWKQPLKRTTLTLRRFHPYPFPFGTSLKKKKCSGYLLLI